MINLEKTLRRAKRFTKDSIIGLSLGSLLYFSACSSKPTEPEPPNFPTITKKIDNSKDNTLTIKDYEVILPANSLETDSLSDSATVTFSITDAIFPETGSEIKTEKVRFFSNNSLLDTIIFKFPNVANSPFGYSIVRDSNSQRNYLFEGKIQGDKAFVPYFPVQDSTLKKPANGITSDIIIDFEWEPKLNQKVELYGDANSITSSNDPALIMVHGLGSSPLTFQEVGPTGKTHEEEMKTIYDNRIFLFQYPSGKPVLENADSLIGRLLALRERTPNLVFDGICHSMGGAVFRAAVQEHPELFRKMVTMGTPHDGVIYEEDKKIIDLMVNNDIGFYAFFKLKGFFTPGAKDLYHGSDFLNNLNSYNNFINVDYLTIAGDKENPFLSWIVDGDSPDDGFVALRSAAMGHASFPYTREKPIRLESPIVNMSHQDFTKGSYELYTVTKNFLENILDPPIASLIITPDSGVAPLQISADASGSTSGLPIKEYNFNFGDGTFYNETETSNDGVFDGKTNHVYNLAGNHLAKLKITDSGDRTSSDSLEVKVIEATNPIGKIAFVRIFDGNADIYTMNPDGSDLKNLTNTLFSWESWPSWSPDGKKILYSLRESSSNNLDLYVMNADGSNKKRLTNTPTNEYKPVFSPDGNNIAYILEWKDLILNQFFSQIFIVDTNGANPASITNDSNNNYDLGSWSPESKIVFGSNRDRTGSDNLYEYDIYTINPDGSGLNRLTNNNYFEFNPSWSPDKNKIAFNSNGGGFYDIWAMNSDGSSQTNLTNDFDTDDWNPSWSSDGKKIVYESRPRSSPSESWEIWMIDYPSGMNKTKITDNNYADFAPSWSPK